MNILITGGTGFIGTHLIKALSNHYKIHVLVPPDLDFTVPEYVSVFEFSENIRELHQYINENQIEGIIHLATLYVAQHQAEQIKDIILSNVYLGTAILESIKNTQVKWFINTGTYWQNFKSDSKEYCPANLYAASKQAFIDMAAFYTETSSLRFVTLKLSDTFGKGDTRRKLFNIFKEAADTKEPLLMSKGEQYLDILYIDDIISGFTHLINLLEQDKELLNEYVLVAQQRYNLKEIAGIFEKVSGKKLQIVWGGRPYREREIMCPWQKGTPLPGWKAKLSLE
ncbi:MAG: NAD(P)-dependent oxidoreductase, partial [Bacteroidales bacterium]|nr:NAD(P)-dependent oxidoreductase [Bacteroidales bacterium]